VCHLTRSLRPLVTHSFFFFGVNFSRHRIRGFCIFQTARVFPLSMCLHAGRPRARSTPAAPCFSSGGPLIYLSATCKPIDNQTQLVTIIEKWKRICCLYSPARKYQFYSCHPAHILIALKNSWIMISTGQHKSSQVAAGATPKVHIFYWMNDSVIWRKWCWKDSISKLEAIYWHLKDALAKISNWFL